MKRLIAGLAFLSSLAAFVVIVGGGLSLVLIEKSGERGAGALLALCGTIAFAAAMLLIFAKTGTFAGRSRRAGALIAALLGVLPVAALGSGALRFAGFPYGSAMPLIEWPVFGAGLVFALGSLSILAVGYWRSREAPPARARPEAVRPLMHPAAAPQPAVQRARPDEPEPPQRLAPVFDDDDEVRVTPVELPSIGQFRRR